MKAEIDRIKEDYARDGAAILRGVLDASWVARMQQAVDEHIERANASLIEYTPEGKRGRFVGDFFMWMRHEPFRALALESPLPALAAKILGASSVRLFYDQLLVKEPETQEPTPWHQDLPYWPFRGEDILSMWVALDPVRLETGAVKYARGSHKAGTLYAPRAFGPDSGFGELYARMGLPAFPDEATITRNHEFISWNAEPGDVVIHHPLTFHSASGNASADLRRRAISVRYMGEDVRYDARPGTFVEKASIQALLREPIRIVDGKPPEGANFPVAWPRA